MSNNCEKYQNLFYLGVGSDLPSKVQADFEKHLRECKVCRIEFDKLSSIHNVLKQTQENLSKLESEYNLDSACEKNINNLKSKMRYNRSKQNVYFLRPLVASFAILAVSMFILFFIDKPHSNIL